jgi:molybdate transport system substrate-binding protein
MPWLAGGSLVVLAILIVLLYLESNSVAVTTTAPPVKVYCAAALRPVMQAIAADYERETGARVILEFGDSGKMLGQVTIRPDGDVFLPADDSYVRLAESKGLVARTIPVCRMQVLVLRNGNNPLPIASLDDMIRPGLKLGIANPNRAAIGKVVRDHLAALGKWDALSKRIDVQHLNVTDAANAVALGNRDATFVWDAVAANYPELTTVRLPELADALGRVEMAVLVRSPNTAGGIKFARFVTASDRGVVHLRKAGFAEVEASSPWGGSP